MLGKKSKIDNTRFTNFSAEKKLDLSIELYYSARELKKAALAKFHPDWDSVRINKKTIEIFLNART